MRIFAMLFLLICYVGTNGQAIDNSWAYKNITDDHYFRINYENDFFSGTDVYYTQGIHLELTTTGLRRFPLMRLLIRPRGWTTRYGVGLEHDGYTPRSYSTPFILRGDYPFSACLFLKTFKFSVDSVHQQRLSTSISTGVIGQAAGGMEMQTFIHRALGDVIPHGWPNQVHNDAIVNYQANYEKQLLAVGNVLNISADAMARAGTLSDEGSAGITFLFGFFDSPFAAGPSTPGKWHIYGYEHAETNLVLYDATLEGGMFNHTSPYTVPATDVKPVLFQNRFGIVVNYRRVYLEYFQSYLSPQFRQEDFHVWGGVQVAWGF